MPQIVETRAPEAQREVIGLALDDLATEIGIGLSVAQLDFPVYVAIPNSGESLATMACPLDPTDTEWSHASAIVGRIIAKRLGDVRLRGRPLPCAVANAKISATDVIADVESGE